MNERIDEIAYQSGCNRTKYYDPGPPAVDGWIITQDELEKFALLIIKECIVQCQSNSPDVDRYSDEYDNGVNFGVNECVLSIKTQFGVKE